MPDRMVIAYEDATGVLKPLTVGNADGAALPVGLATLLAGENQPLSLIETSAPGAYVNGNAVTSGADINLGSPGAAGNKLYGIAVFNDNSTQPITAVTLWDGSTQLAFLGSLNAANIADNTRWTWTPPGGVLESKNGGWRMRITAAGATMANIRWGAVVAE